MQLLPKDEKFFDLFVQQADVFRKASRSLNDAAASGIAAISRGQERVTALEKESDEIFRQILERLNRTFITPIDPEDVSQIASGLENLTDHVETLAFRLAACDLDPLPPSIAQLTKGFDDAAAVIESLFGQLQKNEMRDKDAIQNGCKEARDHISKVICMARDEIREAYRREKDPLVLIKVKDIFDRFETTARAYRRLTDAIQNVVAKNT